MPVTTHRRDNIDILSIENQYAHADISLFGGHVLGYTPKSDGRQRLWMSKQARFDGKTALRGGVPVCWPWFADRHGQVGRSLPSHGFVRNQPWRILQNEDSSQGTRLQMQPTSLDFDGPGKGLSVQLEILVADKLEMRLVTQNKTDTPMSFTCALHSYFAVGDIHQVELQGLTGKYEDKIRDFAQFDTPSPYLFDQVTDRVHQAQPKRLKITEQDQQIEVFSSGHDSIVVWNPWQQGAENMADMQDDGYVTMLCVETAITQGLELAPGERHVLTQRVS